MDRMLALRSKSATGVLSALRQGRASFPFPILGLDTDNGCEFINECLLAYCEQEHITFTRGREGLKNDQCFVEQKNGAIVRQVVGYTRLAGEQDYQQLDEMYQALRLYVNGFQPSMKLQAKHLVGRKVRRVYDAAKTPVQRLLLSQVLAASKEHELLREVRLLDPLRLFHHLQDLQLALLNFSPDAEGISPVALLPFCIQQCIGKSHAAALECGEEAWQEEEVVHTETADLFSSGKQEDKIDHRGPSTCPSAVTSCQQTMKESSFPSQL